MATTYSDLDPRLIDEADRLLDEDDEDDDEVVDDDEEADGEVTDPHELTT